MPDGTDFIMGPILAGMCSYESALDGRLTLLDFGRMNDALAVCAENTRPK